MLVSLAKDESVKQAHVLSNNCISKLNDSFVSEDVKDLLSLAKFMVERKKLI